MNIAPEIADEIICRDEHKCVYCGFKGDSFEKWLQLSIDYLIPKSQGGTDDSENLITVCNHCKSVTSSYQVPQELLAVDNIDIQKKKIINEKKMIVISHRRSVFERWRQSLEL